MERIEGQGHFEIVANAEEPVGVTTNPHPCSASCSSQLQQCQRGGALEQ